MKKIPFDKMTAAQKRVAIARDVVAQIKLNTYGMMRGGYARVAGVVAINQDTIKQSVECSVCAAGACALSAMRLGNHFKFDSQFLDGADTFSVLDKWFSKHQSLLIEDAFEDFNNANRERKTRAFHERFNNSKSRALAIFRNIIANKGTFKP